MVMILVVKISGRKKKMTTFLYNIRQKLGTDANYNVVRYHAFGPNPTIQWTTCVQIQNIGPCCKTNFVDFWTVEL